MLREVVSSLGLGFFPVAAMIIFIAVYLSVIIRMHLRTDKDHASAMARKAIETDDATALNATPTQERTP